MVPDLDLNLALESGIPLDDGIDPEASLTPLETEQIARIVAMSGEFEIATLASLGLDVGMDSSASSMIDGSLMKEDQNLADVEQEGKGMQVGPGMGIMDTSAVPGLVPPAMVNMAGPSLAQGVTGGPAGQQGNNVPGTLPRKDGDPKTVDIAKQQEKSKRSVGGDSKSAELDDIAPPTVMFITSNGTEYTTSKESAIIDISDIPSTSAGPSQEQLEAAGMMRIQPLTHSRRAITPLTDDTSMDEDEDNEMEVDDSTDDVTQSSSEDSKVAETEKPQDNTRNQTEEKTVSPSFSGSLVKDAPESVHSVDDTKAKATLGQSETTSVPEPVESSEPKSDEGKTASEITQGTETGTSSIPSQSESDAPSLVESKDNASVPGSTTASEDTGESPVEEIASQQTQKVERQGTETNAKETTSPSKDGESVPVSAEDTVKQTEVGSDPTGVPSDIDDTVKETVSSSDEPKTIEVLPGKEDSEKIDLTVQTSQQTMSSSPEVQQDASTPSSTDKKEEEPSVAEQPEESMLSESRSAEANLSLIADAAELSRAMTLPDGGTIETTPSDSQQTDLSGTSERTDVMETVPTVDESATAKAPEVETESTSVTPSGDAPVSAGTGMAGDVSEGHPVSDPQVEIPPPSIGPGGDAGPIPTPPMVPMGVPSLFGTSSVDIPGPSGQGTSGQQEMAGDQDMVSTYTNQPGPSGVPVTMSSMWTPKQVFTSLNYLSPMCCNKRVRYFICTCVS